MDDKKIIELYHARSEEALKETDVKYGKLISFSIGKILLNHSDREECMNDTYLGIWMTIPPQKPDNLKAYILKIARNQALKKYEYIHAAKRDIDKCMPIEELNNFIKVERENFSDIKELKDALEEFMDGLSKVHRQVFMLRYWYFMSIKEIAQSCNMSISKTESILFRVRQKLKVFLTERRFL